MKSLMYHYVRPQEDEPPYGYYHLRRADFAAQLEYLTESFTVLDRERFLATVRGDRTPEPDDVVLTFDDGLRDHHAHVYPELERRDLWGIFYVPAGPYLDDRVLDVHRIHTLFGACGGGPVADALDDLVTPEMIPPARRDEFEDAYHTQDSSDAVSRAKRLLNYYLEPPDRTRLLTELIDRLLGEPLDSETYYMSRSQLRDLHDAGHLIGGHSVSHPVLASLPETDQHREIADSMQFLADVLGDLPVRSFCYPYGRPNMYTETTVSLLEDTDCEFSFGVESRDIERSDLRESPQTLPRYDCNEFRHGAATASLG